MANLMANKPAGPAASTGVGGAPLQQQLPTGPPFGPVPH